MFHHPPNPPAFGSYSPLYTRTRPQRPVIAPGTAPGRLRDHPRIPIMALAGNYLSSDEDGDPEASRPDGWGAASLPWDHPSSCSSEAAPKPASHPTSSARGPHPCFSLPTAARAARWCPPQPRTAGMSTTEPVRAGSVRLRVYLGRAPCVLMASFTIWRISCSAEPGSA